MKYQYLFNRKLWSFLFLMGSMTAGAQLTVDTAVNANDLANQILGTGVTVSNVQLDCADNGAGIFNQGQTTNIGIEDGILLTTGSATDAIGPNSAGNTTVNTSQGSDPDLANIVSFSLQDACVLEFDFEAQADMITVQYVFGSEEYNEYVCSEFNDVFAFFVNGPNPGGGSYTNQNVALIPGSGGLPVAINTLNNGSPGIFGDEGCESLAYSSLFNDNSGGTTIEYDGFTAVLTAEIAIIPGDTYTFKFAIADASDGLFDSGVFIKANSFSVFNCDAGTLSTQDETETCSTDDIADVVTVTTNSNATGDIYEYFITDESGTILDINSSGTFDLSLYGEGNYNIYGISYDGTISGFVTHNNISEITVDPDEGCFEITSALSVSHAPCCVLDVECPDSDGGTFACIGDVPGSNEIAPIVNDHCGDLHIDTSESDNGGSGCIGDPLVITYTYTISDDNDTEECTVSLTVVDDVAPSLIGVPADATVECNEIPDPSNVSAEDNCPGVSIEFSESIENVCPPDPDPLTNPISDCGNGESYHLAGGYSVEFSGFEQDPNDCKTYFYYCVNNAGVSPEISHANFGAIGCENTCLDDLSSSDVGEWSMGPNGPIRAPGNGTPQFGVDPTTDYCGVKFDESVSGTAQYYICVDGLQSPGTIEFVVKAGQNVASVELPGPVECSGSCNPCDECTYTITRTWTAIDHCGNSVTESQVLTVTDSTPPTIDCPADVTVNCGDDSSPGSTGFATATDNCGNATVTFSDNFDPLCGEAGVIVRTWTATDDCGNTRSCEQIITIEDNTPPVFLDDPQDFTVNCGETIPEAIECLATDECSLDENIQYSFEEIITGPLALLECATGDASNHTIWIGNTNAVFPGVDGPNFNADTETQFTELANGEARIDGEVIINGDSNKRIRYALWLKNKRTYEEWTAIPNGSSPTGFRQAKLDGGTSVTITDEYLDWDYYEFDDAKPNLLIGLGDFDGLQYEMTPMPADYRYGVQVGEKASLQSEGQGLSSWMFINGVNQNGQEVSVQGDFNISISLCEQPEVEITCADSYTITRIWTATDECGNTSTIDQVITIGGDDEAPEIHCPDDITVDCEDSIHPDNTGHATAEDNCGEVTITHEDSEMMGDCPYTITRTWTATDDCGNSASCEQVITITDTQAPHQIGDTPEVITVECNDEVPGFDPVFGDNCDHDLDYTAASSIAGDGCESVITRSKTATDDCGNSTTISQTVNILDTTAPTIHCPADITIECTQGQGPDITGEATAEDNCNEVTITFSDGDPEGDCPYTFVRTWTATDACGNASSCNQLITVTDTQAPFQIGDTPEVITVECNDEVPGFDPVFGDNCDHDLDYTAASSIAGDGCESVITRSKTATDDCGNSTTISQTVNILDTTAPTIHCPADITIECTQGQGPDITGEATAEDNCNEVTITFSDGDPEGDCPYTFVRTWTATDACGNASSCNQLITVTDTQAPFQIGDTPDVITVECNDEVPGFDPVFGDNCDHDLDYTAASSIAGDGCESVITRSKTATDDCGNSTTISQTVNILDTTAPTIHCPADITIECTQSQEPDITGEATAEDNCNEVTITFSDGDPEGDCPYTFVRTWTATDACGNASSCNQLITVTDTQAPFQIGDTPEVITVECDDEVPGFDPAFGDNCDLDLTFTAISSISTSDDGCTQVISRSKTATDDCGNSTTISQTVNIVDTTAPTFDQLPISLSISCEEDLPAVPQLTASDNCQQPVQVTYNGQTIDDSECPVIVTRSWTANDGCGNSTDVEQVITIIDDEAPVFDEFPYFVQVSCEAVEDYMVTATDNCSEVEITFTEQLQSGGCYGNLVRLWKATDACGNMTTAEQIIGITDFIAPTIEGVGEDMTIDCSEDYLDYLPNVNAFDNCGDVELSFNEEIIEGDCPAEFTVVWTWTAVDFCENVSTAEKTITVVDNDAPVFVEVPANLDLDCSEVVPAAGEVLVEDNCSTFSVTFAESEDELDCPQNRVIVRTWTAVDACGNTSTATQTITITDTTGPEISGVAEELVFLCTETIPEPSGVVVTDDCGEATWDYSDVIINGECESEYTIERTFTAEDSCGNESSFLQIINIIDEEAPVLSGSPADLVIDCEADIPAPEVLTATDNCDTEVSVVFEETFEGDEPTPGSVRDCELFTPEGPACDNSDSWSLRLFGFQGSTTDFHTTEAYWVEFPDGTAHLTGHVFNLDDPEAGFDIDVWFENGMNWDMWSNQDFPTNYKDDCNIAGENYLDWTYYIMTAGQATLTGTGVYSGSSLELEHAPSNLYYGFQVGVAANNLNGNDGIGGWFTVEGELVINNDPVGMVDLSADFAFDIDCCPRYEVVRTWTATDCAGNTSSWTQTISFAQLGDQAPQSNLTSCREDLNGDGTINTADLVLLLGAFGCDSGECEVDVDGNGLTNTGDLVALLGKMGQDCE